MRYKDEFQRLLARYARCQQTPFAMRAKRFGRSWPWMAANVWTVAEECGYTIEEARTHIARAESLNPVRNVEQLLPVVPN